MDASEQAQEDNSDGTALTEAFDRLSEATGLKFPAAGIAALQTALVRFASNRDRWNDPNYGFGMLDPVLWKHCLFTLWVPGGKASKVRTAIDLLDQDGWFDRPSDSWDTDILAEKISPYVRFPKQKARRTKTALANIRSMFRTTVPVPLAAPAGATGAVTIDLSAAVTHATVVQTVSGMGNKAAAHFMRNTGLSTGWDAIPIIDVHILKFLGDGYSASRYGQASWEFRARAHAYDVPPLLLDAALWCAYANNWNISKSDFDNFGG